MMKPLMSLIQQNQMLDLELVQEQEKDLVLEKQEPQ